MGYLGSKVVANIAALPRMSLNDGDFTYVMSVRDPWQFVTNGTEFVVDHITVEATSLGGNTRWVRELSANEVWRTAIAHVYIDSIGGNDENQGIYYTAAPPPFPQALKTAQELYRRWGQDQIVTSEATTLETILHIKNAITLASHDSLQLCWRAGPNSFFRILGENTTLLHAGTLDNPTGFTPWDPTGPSGGSATVIKDTTSGVVWTSYIGKRIHFPRVNSWAYILKDLGGGSVRISIPQLGDEAGFNYVPANTFPANGDAYAIEDPVVVSVGEINLDSVANQGDMFGPLSITNISNITFAISSTIPEFLISHSSFTVQVTFYQCVLPGVFINGPSAENVIFSNCTCWQLGEEADSQTGSGGLAFLGGALVHSGTFSGNQVSGGLGDIGVIDYYTTIQSGYVIAHGDTQIRSFSAWDAISTIDNPDGHGVLIGAPGHHSTAGLVDIANRANTPIFGNGHLGTGLFVGTSSSARWEIIPNITGTAGDFQLGSGGRARYFDEGTGTYSNPAMAETWANLNAPQPGGFGASAHDLTDEAHLIKL